MMMTGAQDSGKNRKLTVITSDLMLLTMEAEYWQVINSDATGIENIWVRVYKAEPGRGTPSLKIAEFADVAAIYFSDDVTLVKPDD